MGERELRLIGVSVTIEPEVNEQALVENLQEELINNDIFGNAIEFGTVDIYEHHAHSGAREE